MPELKQYDKLDGIDSFLNICQFDIEKGRCFKTYNMYTISCNEGELEDEHHFFSKCPHYYQQRTNFIKTLKKYIKVPCTNIPLSIKIISILLNNTSRDLLKITIKYMKDCWQHRVNNFNYTN